MDFQGVKKDATTFIEPIWQGLPRFIRGGKDNVIEPVAKATDY